MRRSSGAGAAISSPSVDSAGRLSRRGFSHSCCKSRVCSPMREARYFPVEPIARLASTPVSARSRTHAEVIAAIVVLPLVGRSLVAAPLKATFDAAGLSPQVACSRGLSGRGSVQVVHRFPGSGMRYSTRILTCLPAYSRTGAPPQTRILAAILAVRAALLPATDISRNAPGYPGARGWWPMCSARTKTRPCPGIGSCARTDASPFRRVHRVSRSRPGACARRGSTCATDAYASPRTKIPWTRRCGVQARAGAAYDALQRNRIAARMLPNRRVSPRSC